MLVEVEWRSRRLTSCGGRFMMFGKAFSKPSPMAGALAVHIRAYRISIAERGKTEMPVVESCIRLR